MMTVKPVHLLVCLASLQVVSLSSLVVSAGSCLLPFFKSNVNNPVAELNEYLVDHAASSELAANLAAAKELLQTEKEFATSCQAKNELLLEVIKQFLALEMINDENVCQENAVEAISKLSDSLRAHGRKPFKEPEARRRLNKIVADQVRSQFKKCVYIFEGHWSRLEQYHARMPRADLDHKLAHLTSLTDAISSARTFHQPKTRYNNQVGYLIAHTGEEITNEVVREALVKVVKRETRIDRLKEVDQRSGHLVRTEFTVARFLDEYLWKPCEWLVNELDVDRKSLLERTFKLIRAADLEMERNLYPNYHFSGLLKWTTNLSTCRRLLMRASKKENLARQIHWQLNLG